MFGHPLYWRETHKQPKVLFFDGRLAVLFLFAAVHIRLWTLGLAIAVTIIFAIFERYGVKPDSILRHIRTKLVGDTRYAQGERSLRQPVDYGFETAQSVKTFTQKARLAFEARKKAEVAKRQYAGKAKRRK